jgi:hypothetical protein
MSSRAWLFWIWLLGYVACLVLLFVFIRNGEAKIANFPDYLATLTSIYAPYLGSITAFWASRHSKERVNQGSRQPFLITVTCSIVFNIVVILLLTSVEFQSEGFHVIEATLTSVSRSAAILSVFTAPSVGYFFGKSFPNQTTAQQAGQQQPTDRVASGVS